jgi:hypothetical protein
MYFALSNMRALLLTELHYREAETVRFAIKRNIIALAIIIFLIYQFFQRFLGAVTEKFLVQEVWEEWSFNPNEMQPAFLASYHIGMDVCSILGHCLAKLTFLRASPP